MASCQHWETGHYTAYEHMAAENADLVFHLGDNIYEGPGRDTTVLIYYIYQQVTGQLSFGYSSAMAIFLLVVARLVQEVQEDDAGIGRTEGARSGNEILFAQG